MLQIQEYRHTHLSYLFSVTVKSVFCTLFFSQVLVPSLLVPSQSAVCHVCVQPSVGAEHPFLLLLQRSSPGVAAHEYLLVPGEDTDFLI